MIRTHPEAEAEALSWLKRAGRYGTAVANVYAVLADVVEGGVAAESPPFKPITSSLSVAVVFEGDLVSILGRRISGSTVTATLVLLRQCRSEVGKRLAVEEGVRRILVGWT